MRSHRIFELEKHARLKFSISGGFRCWWRTFTWPVLYIKIDEKENETRLRQNFHTDKPCLAEQDASLLPWQSWTTYGFGKCGSWQPFLSALTGLKNLLLSSTTLCTIARRVRNAKLLVNVLAHGNPRKAIQHKICNHCCVTVKMGQ